MFRHQVEIILFVQSFQTSILGNNLDSYAIYVLNIDSSQDMSFGCETNHRKQEGKITVIKQGSDFGQTAWRRMKLILHALLLLLIYTTVKHTMRLGITHNCSAFERKINANKDLEIKDKFFQAILRIQRFFSLGFYFNLVSYSPL